MKSYDKNEIISGGLSGILKDDKKVNINNEKESDTFNKDELLRKYLLNVWKNHK